MPRTIYSVEQSGAIGIGLYLVLKGGLSVWSKAVACTPCHSAAVIPGPKRLPVGRVRVTATVSPVLWLRTVVLDTSRLVGRVRGLGAREGNVFFYHTCRR